VTPLLDALIVLDDVDSDGMSVSGWLPLPRSRGAAPDPADAGLALAGTGPESVVITGFATAAEQGLKPSRRGAARNVRPGSEVFQTLCGMIASGARVILLSRWRTGGRTNLALVHEFVRELPHRPPTEAWQRACLLAHESQLDPQNEPRLKGVETTGNLPTAKHPFFWAGYLLVDTTPRTAEPMEKQQSATITSIDVPAPKETPIAKPAATPEDSQDVPATSTQAD
jgi:hypothetical protein